MRLVLLAMQAFSFYVCIICYPPRYMHNSEINRQSPAPKTDQNSPPEDRTDEFLVRLMQKYPAYFNHILAFRDQLKVQIIYTQIDRDASNKPHFRDYYFHVNPDRYFYPASTVKMPVAALALQRLHELGKPGIGSGSTMITGKEFDWQLPVYNDPTSADGRPSVAQYVRKIFLVSDNDAFNRLYEFLGPDYINRQLWDRGYTDAQIRHRLAQTLSAEQNRQTNPVSFLDSSGNLLYLQPGQYSTLGFTPRNDRVGNGYLDDRGSLVESPLDFSGKNRISLEDQHHILRSIMFPQDVPAAQRFKLASADYDLLYRYMSQYPSESAWPYYDSSDFWDAYGKFLFWGSEKGPLPKQIRIFNKVGDAYGFLTDIMYLADFSRHIEFMLSATIYCNSDGILNDDRYDYDSLGYPFMKNLGRVIYDYEKGRKRKYTPDLSRFRVNYDR